MKTADHVLELLFDRGEKFYLADDLARATGLTARRLSGALELLRGRGHELEFSPAQGLRLRRPVNLDAHLIERGLGTRRVGRHVICFDEVESTNDVAFDCARQRGADGLTVLAQWQRQGRGRHGRRWQSPRGANVLMSVLLAEQFVAQPCVAQPRVAQPCVAQPPSAGDAQPDTRTGATSKDTAEGGCATRKTSPHELLTIAAGLAVAQGVEDAAGLDCRLKWPNDVLVEGGKLAGVLVEVRTVGGAKWAVIGIGVNANAHPPAGQVDFPATSVAEHTGGPANRLAIVQAVMRRLDQWLADLPAINSEERLAGLPGAMADLRSSWLARCDMINQRLTVSSAGRRHVGRVLDVSPLEGLTLLCDDGRRVQLPAASSSIVG
jgi:BirA family biotin operon repressor/biotin-[acetyl-CoA-carboxylase] ligase